MRYKRQKRINKLLNFYVNNFGFHKPYQVLIDGTFCQAALTAKFNIQDQLPSYLGEVKLLTTPCVIMETEKLGPSVYGAMLIVKQFKTVKCGHDNQTKTGSACLRSFFGRDNHHRYFLASQDRELQKSLSRIPGAPVLYLHNKALNLEGPSAASFKAIKKGQTNGLFVSNEERQILKHLKQTELPQPTIPVKPIRKRKMKGGPNPLSCKKKKKKNPAPKTTSKATHTDCTQ